MKRAAVLIDEPAVRAIVHTMLRRNGFLTEEFSSCLRPESSSDCNLDCCSTETAPDLVVMEVVVPRDCTGSEAALKALRRWPAVKVLLTSATPRDFWPPEAARAFASLPQPSSSFLAKPFTAQQFDAAIRGLIGA